MHGATLNIEKSAVGSAFFGAFPSDRIPKATKDVSVHFFIHSSNCYKLYRRIAGTFWSYCVLVVSTIKHCKWSCGVCKIKHFFLLFLDCLEEGNCTLLANIHTCVPVYWLSTEKNGNLKKKKKKTFVIEIVGNGRDASSRVVTGRIRDLGRILCNGETGTHQQRLHT